MKFMMLENSWNEREGNEKYGIDQHEEWRRKIKFKHQAQKDEKTMLL